MATETNGGATSGNSSVCRRSRAIKPNTVSASMLTTVMIGLRIAKSEINTVGSPRRRSARRRLVHAHCGWGAWREPGRPAHQDRVTGRDALPHLDSLVYPVLEPGLDLHPLHPSTLEPHHQRTDAAAIDRG